MIKLKKQNQSLKSKLFFLSIVSIVWLGLAAYLFNENPLRSFVLVIGLILWLVYFAILKNLFLSSLLWILTCFPFNITLQLATLSDPFVDGIKVNYLIPTISIIDIGLFLALSSAFVEGLFFRLSKKAYLILAAFVLYFVIHISYFHNSLTTLASLRYLAFLSLPLSLHSSTWLPSFPKLRRFVPKIIFISTLLQSIIGILQFYKGASLGLSFLGESSLLKGVYGTSFADINGNIVLRAYGTFPHPNIFAAYMILIFLFSFALLRYLLTKHSRNIIHYIYAFTLSLIATISIFFSFSRSAIFILLLGWVFLVFSLFITRFKTKSFKLASFGFFSRFGQLFSEKDYSLTDRTALIESALFIIKRHWVFGVGSGQFTRYLADFDIQTKNGFALFQPVHNIFLLVAAEHGLFGFTLFLSAIVFAFSKIRISIISIYTVLIIIIIGSSDHFLISLPQGLILFLLFIFLNKAYSDIVQ